MNTEFKVTCYRVLRTSIRFASSRKRVAETRTAVNGRREVTLNIETTLLLSVKVVDSKRSDTGTTLQRSHGDIHPRALGDQSVRIDSAKCAGILMVWGSTLLDLSRRKIGSFPSI
jgi:hypothetical protein